eukprot:SAG11_NODE_2052_length_3879_cov_2.030159_7_plen_60_part_00
MRRLQPGSGDPYKVAWRCLARGSVAADGRTAMEKCDDTKFSMCNIRIPAFFKKILPVDL